MKNIRIFLAVLFELGFGLVSMVSLSPQVSASDLHHRRAGSYPDDAPSADAYFFVNSRDDTNSNLDGLTLREAILIANGGTGGNGTTTGLGRALNIQEEKQLVNCLIDGSGHITGGCGPGFVNHIKFDVSLGAYPQFILVGNLPPINSTQSTILNGFGSYPIIFADLAQNPFTISSNGNTIEYITLRDFNNNGILVFSNNNLLYSVTVTATIVSDGISIVGDGNTIDQSFVSTIGGYAGGTGINIAGNSNKVGGSTLRQNAIGVWIEGGSNNIIGGPSFGNSITGNVISANETGVKLAGGSFTLLAGNKIGTTADGSSADGNNANGVEVNLSNANYIGDPAAAPNVISGNGGYGVFIQDNHTNQVANNYIGTNASLASIGNQQGGIWLYGSMTDTVSTNVIAYNAWEGVVVSSSNNNPGQGNTIQNNTIMSNHRDGVLLTGEFLSVTNNLISGDSIDDNTLDGIHEGVNASSNWWTQISTYNNGGLGIHKAAATPPHPSITTASSNGVQWTVSGTATASDLFSPVSVEVYLAAPDPSGFGEGKTYLGNAPVDKTGHWSLNTPDSNFGCFTAFETPSSIFLGTAASSDFSQNVCRVRSFMPLIIK